MAGGGGAAPRDAPLVQQHQRAGVLAGGGQVVQRGQHGDAAAAAQLVDQLEHPLGVPDVQARRRLVEQQHPRLRGQRAGQHHALALAAGQGGQPPPGEPRHVQPPGGLGGGLAVAAGRAAEVAQVRGAAEQHVLLDGHVRRQHRRLRQVRDQPGAAAAAHAAKVGAVEQHGAAVPHQPGHRAQQGGLARPVRPDQGEPAAGADRERHPAQHRDPVQVHGEILHGDGAHVRIALVERRIQTNTGEPASAVTTPIGSSAGATTVRAAVSASTRKPAPQVSESGSTNR